jgi:hypothetical protein
MVKNLFPYRTGRIPLTPTNPRQSSPDPGEMANLLANLTVATVDI